MSTSGGGWASVEGGLGGIAARFEEGRHAGDDDGGWDDFHEDNDRRLPRNFLNQGGLRTHGFQAASMDVSIPSRFMSFIF